MEVIREVTMLPEYVGIAMADVDWKMPLSDKKAIKEASPKKDVAIKSKEPFKK